MNKLENLKFQALPFSGEDVLRVSPKNLLEQITKNKSKFFLNKITEDQVGLKHENFSGIFSNSIIPIEYTEEFIRQKKHMLEKRMANYLSNSYGHSPEKLKNTLDETNQQSVLSKTTKLKQSFLKTK